MTEEELKMFEDFLQNMSATDFNKITGEVEHEIFTEDFCKELENMGV